MVLRITEAPSLSDRFQKLQAEWEYIEDPTYSRSIDSHVCITCSEFAYTSQASYGSIPSCNRHQKIFVTVNI